MRILYTLFVLFIFSSIHAQTHLMIMPKVLEEENLEYSDSTNSDALVKAKSYYQRADKLYDNSRHNEAIAWYKKSADLGSISAMRTLGYI